MDWKAVQEIYHLAMELPAQWRDGFVRDRCGDDHELRAEVLSLVAAFDEQDQFTPPPTEEPSRSGERIGAWQLVRLIGRGGMGAVYEAERAEGGFRQRAALKLLHPAMAAPMFAERFQQERQILAGLNHPFITQLIDGGLTKLHEPYLVMEFVEGQQLDEFAARANLNLPARVELFRKICAAVDYAHRHLVIHRDLKPENIVVQDDGTPKLLDFGTAKLVSENMKSAPGKVTRHGMHTFTPEYASPEQVMGQPVSTASDIYSLGVVLYELLAGKLPYQLTEYSMAEMIRVICEQEPPTMSQAAPGAGLDQDLDAIVGMAMRKDPAERYRSVDAFTADLLAWSRGLPVAARRPTAGYRMVKFVRRNRALTVAVSAAAVILVGGMAGILWQSHVARQQRDRAQARFQDLRRLTNTLLFDLNDAVAQLPGSTPARRLIVTRGLAALDKLSADAAADDTLRQELIDAYLKFGTLQGNPYEQNLGDQQGALKSYDKAAQLAGELPDERMRNYLGGQVLQSRAEVLFVMGRTQEGVRYAVDGCRMQAEGARTASEFAQAASCFDSLADQYNQVGAASLADPQKAAEALQRSRELNSAGLKLEPGHIRLLRGRAILLLKSGTLVRERQPLVALQLYEQALRSLDELPASEQASLRVKRVRAYITAHKGRAHLEAKQYADALRFLEAARDYYEPLARLDPANAQAQFDLAVQVNLEGNTREQMGDTAGALAAYRRVERLIEPFIGNPKAPVSMRGAHAEILVRVGYLMKSPADAARGIAESRRMADDPAAQFQDYDRVVRMLLWFPSGPLRNPALAVDYARRGIGLHKSDRPDAWLLLAEALAANGSKEETRAAAKKGLALLPPDYSVTREKLEALAR
ncbi:MAG: serine/threonine protein kinase [Acidobacteria bacterium]|nr:serine/threonine protein kinase [Acidobacteriota bacterium]